MFNKFLPLPGKAFPVFQYKSESNMYPAPSDFKKKQNFAFFSVILLAVSSFDYVSSVLNWLGYLGTHRQTCDPPGEHYDPLQYHRHLNRKLQEIQHDLQTGGSGSLL